MSKELLAGIVNEQQMKIYAEETKNLQDENAKLKEKLRLLRIEVSEALEALLGDDFEDATEILKQILRG